MSEERSTHFQLVAGNAVLDFVNTLDDRFAADGPKELLGSYSDLLRFTEQARVISPEDARGLTALVSGSGPLTVALQLREYLAKVFYKIIYLRPAGHPGKRLADGGGRGPESLAVKNPDPAAPYPPLREVAAFDAICRSALSARRLRWTDAGGSPHLEWTWPEDDAQVPVWRLAVAAVELLTSRDLEWLRACEVGTCRWLFLDTSKNRTRRWCDMKVCGNRVKSQRYKARAASK